MLKGLCATVLRTSHSDVGLEASDLGELRTCNKTPMLSLPSEEGSAL